MSARIVSNPDVMLGKPVVDGTRITVELIVEKLSYGEDVNQILDSYPTLTREGVLAAITYAVVNRNPKIKRLRQIARTLGVTVDELMKG